MPTNPHSSFTCGPILNSSAENGIHAASTVHSSTEATNTLQSIVVYISRYAGERAVTTARFITTESDDEKRGRGIEEMGKETESRCPDDDDEDDGFSCFISVPSGKYRTAVLLKLGHDHFLAHTSPFITSYPPPCSMAYTVNRTCTHPGWWGRRDC